MSDTKHWIAIALIHDEGDFRDTELRALLESALRTVNEEVPSVRFELRNLMQVD